MRQHWGFNAAISLLLAAIPTGAIDVRGAVDPVGAVDERSLQYYDDGYSQYNLADYSLRFDKCQYVKTFDDEMAEDEDYDSILAVKHFAVFSLCPSDTCESSCSSNFGQYVAELDEYLELTVQQQQNTFEQMCDNCQEKCNEYGDYCSGCGKLCYRYANLEAEGFVDAAEYIECQALEMDVDDDASQLYIGPRCSADGSRILIGLFSDQYCLDPYVDADPEDYLGAKLSYHLLSHISSESASICLSCKEEDQGDDQNDEDQADADDVTEMCEDIYNVAAKCESKNGIDGGFLQMYKDDGQYENQVENEFMACLFIDSLLANSYTETGDINLEGASKVYMQSGRNPQRTSLSVLTVGIIALLCTVIWMQGKLDKAEPKVDLSAQTDGEIS